MEKKIKMTLQPNEQPECKKIQDYLYRFCDLLGSGNFSKVFKAMHQHTNKQVAIKIIELSSLSNTRLQELLNTETKILKMISHPNVIGCDEILSSARNCYIITELCNGGDLQKRLRSYGALKQRDLFQVAVDVYEGLKYLAKNKIVHRDIKVSNIFINHGVHKIADFGFAQIAENQFKDISVGSPIYMSPEGYINNMYGPKTDVWAFGVLLFELVEGRTPCNDCRSQSELKVCLQKQIDASSFKSSISPELKGLIIQCLCISPSQRINIFDIDHTEWMKKASKFVAQNQRKLNPDKAKDIQHRKSVQLTPQFFAAGRERRASMNFSSHSEFEKIANLAKKKQQLNFIKEKKDETNQNNESEDSENSDNSLEKDNQGSDPKQFFYSPNRTMLAKTSKMNVDKVVDKSMKINPQNKQNGVFSKGKSVWVQKSPIEDSFYPNNDATQKDRKQKDVSRSGKNQSFENLRKLYAANPQNPHHHSTSVLVQKQQMKNIDNRQNQNKPKNIEFPQNKMLKISSNINRTTVQKKKNERIDQSFMLENNSKINFSNSNNKVIDRILKFSDCINLIHYCRLCYKFAGLLEQHAQNQQAKQFLINWSVQLLSELNSKIDLWNSPDELKQNLSGIILDEGKKTKLKEVTGEYLLKYSKSIKTKGSSTMREASSFIYNLYLNQGFLHSDRMQDKKKSQVYSALLCYLSILDKQTRNLMQFIYQIKPTLEGKQMEKLLNMKITELSGKNLQELGFNEIGKENLRV